MERDTKINSLCNKHSEYFADGFYKVFSVDDGWYDIIKEVLDKVKPYLLNGQVKIAQIKEKFAGLRIYLHYKNCTDIDKINEWIKEACEKAEKTCEICGKPGKEESNKVNYLKTVCENCKVYFKD